MPIQGIEFRIESTQEWVSIQNRDPADEDALRILGAGKDGVLTVEYSQIPGNSWNQNRLNNFVAKANELLQTRIPLDDPSLTDSQWGINGTDPDRFPVFYWDSGDLVSQSVEIFDATYEAPDGVGDPELNFGVRQLSG